MIGSRHKGRKAPLFGLEALLLQEWILLSIANSEDRGWGAERAGARASLSQSLPRSIPGFSSVYRWGRTPAILLSRKITATNICLLPFLVCCFEEVTFLLSVRFISTRLQNSEDQKQKGGIRSLRAILYFSLTSHVSCNEHHVSDGLPI